MEIIFYIASAVILIWFAVNVAIFLHEKRRRRKKLENRESLHPDSWFSKYLDVTKATRIELEGLLKEFASIVGVEWTQLRPWDTFSETLCLGNEPNDDLNDIEGISDYLEVWLEEHGLSDSFYEIPNELGQLLEKLGKLLEQTESNRIQNGDIVN